MTRILTFLTIPTLLAAAVMALGEVQAQDKPPEGDKELLEAVEVKVGRKLGDVVEVTAVNGTLQSGERLVLSPEAKLKTGMQVKLGGK